MGEFRVGGWTCRSAPLCAADQWALLERLRPILPALQAMDAGMRLGADDVVDFVAMLAPLLKASDDDMRFVFRTCLAACERFENEAWRPIAETPGLSDLMGLVAQVVALNFRALFAMERPKFTPVAIDTVTYTPVALPGGEDWLLRPVLRGMCKLESLYDGTLRIEQVAKANDALDVEGENQARARAAAARK